MKKVKITITILTIAILCLLCTGCSNEKSETESKVDSIANKDSEVNTDVEINSDAETEQDAKDNMESENEAMKKLLCGVAPDAKLQDLIDNMKEKGVTEYSFENVHDGKGIYLSGNLEHYGYEITGVSYGFDVDEISFFTTCFYNLTDDEYLDIKDQLTNDFGQSADVHEKKESKSVSWNTSEGEISMYMSIDEEEDSGALFLLYQKNESEDETEVEIIPDTGMEIDEFVERYNEAVAYWQLHAGVSWSDIKKMERSDVENSIEEYDEVQINHLTMQFYPHEDNKSYIAK